MTKNPPSENRQRSAVSGSTLLKAAVLATAVATLAAPSASALGLVLDTQTLSIAPTGVLDLKSNNLVVRTTPFNTLYGYVKTGLLNGLNGWDGPGINSSLAAAALNTNSGYAVGILNNSAFGGIYPAALGPWPPAPGVSLNGTETLIKYTYWGDLDLDGQMTAADQSYFNDGYTSGMLPSQIEGGPWFAGDMDFDNAFTPADQSLFNGGYAQYIASGSIALSPGEWTVAPGAASVVPEPGSALLLSLSTFGLLMQRRRNRAES